MIINEPKKIEYQGTTVWRYQLDNRSHYHCGYNLFLDGEANG